MARYRVILEVDGRREEELLEAPSADLAITKAKKAHPTKVVSAAPIDIPLELPLGESLPIEEQMARTRMELGELAGEPEGGEGVPTGPRVDPETGDPIDAGPEFYAEEARIRATEQAAEDARRRAES